MRFPLTAKTCVAAFFLCACASGISSAQDYADSVVTHPDHQSNSESGIEYQDSSFDNGCQTCSSQQSGLFNRGLFSGWRKGNACQDGNCGGCAKCRSGRLKDKIGNWQGGCDGSCGGNCDQCDCQSEVMTSGMAGPDVGSCGCKKCRFAKLKQKLAGSPAVCDGSCGGGCDHCFARKGLKNRKQVGTGIPRGPATGLTMFSKGSRCKDKGCRGCDECQRDGLLSRIANAHNSSDCGCNECQQATQMTEFADAACDGNCGGGCKKCQRQGLKSRFAKASNAGDCGCNECQQATQMTEFADAACDGSCGGGCKKCQRQGLKSRFAKASNAGDCGCNECQQATQMTEFADAACDGSCGGGCKKCQRQGLKSRFAKASNAGECGCNECQQATQMTEFADAALRWRLWWRM